MTFEFYQLKTVKFGRCDRTQISVIKLNPNESERIIVIKIDGDISFFITDAQKKDLYNRGYNYTNMFLKKNDGKAKKR